MKHSYKIQITEELFQYWFSIITVPELNDFGWFTSCEGVVRPQLRVKVTKRSIKRHCDNFCNEIFFHMFNFSTL